MVGNSTKIFKECKFFGAYPYERVLFDGMVKFADSNFDISMSEPAPGSE